MPATPSSPDDTSEVPAKMKISSADVLAVAIERYLQYFSEEQIAGSSTFVLLNVRIENCDCVTEGLLKQADVLYQRAKQSNNRKLLRISAILGNKLQHLLVEKISLQNRQEQELRTIREDTQAKACRLLGELLFSPADA